MSKQQASLPVGELHRIIASSRLPEDLDTLAGRAIAAWEVGNALLEGTFPESRAGALYVGGGLVARLMNGGTLDRDWLQLTSRNGSHKNACFIVREYLRAKGTIL